MKNPPINSTTQVFSYKTLDSILIFAKSISHNNNSLVQVDRSLMLSIRHQLSIFQTSLLQLSPTLLFKSRPTLETPNLPVETVLLTTLSKSPLIATNSGSQQMTKRVSTVSWWKTLKTLTLLSPRKKMPDKLY